MGNCTISLQSVLGFNLLVVGKCNNGIISDKSKDVKSEDIFFILIRIYSIL